DKRHTHGVSFMDAPRGSEVPGWVSRAGSLEELAVKLTIDPTGLSSTVARFNAFARKGVDEYFRRGEAAWCLAKKDVWKPTRADEKYISPTLGTLRIPPFYGVELHPSVFVSGGLVANANSQVINQRAAPIPGLYAAGNNAVHTEYGVGYQAGFSLGSGMTFGSLAARHMAGVQRTRASAET